MTSQAHTLLIGSLPYQLALFWLIIDFSFPEVGGWVKYYTKFACLTCSFLSQDKRENSFLQYVKMKIIFFNIRYYEQQLVLWLREWSLGITGNSFAWLSKDGDDLENKKQHVCSPQADLHSSIVLVVCQEKIPYTTVSKILFWWLQVAPKYPKSPLVTETCIQRLK